MTEPRSPERQRELAGWAALILLACVWGYNWVAVKIALRHTNALDLVAMRTGLGALVLFLVMALSGRSLRPVRVRETVILGLLQTTLFMLVVTLAMVAGDAGKTAILTFTLPFWTLVLAYFWLGERLSLRQVPAVLLVVLGLLLLLEPWSMSAHIVPKLLAVLSGFIWACATVHNRAMALKAPLDALSTAGWQMLYGAPLLVLLALCQHGTPTEWNLEFVLALSFTCVGGSALGWLLWTFVIERLSASVASLASLANPVIALLAGWLQLGERPSLTEAAGMVCIVVALALLGLRR